MDWELDAATARAAEAFPLQRLMNRLMPADQFVGRNFNPENWSHRAPAGQWPPAGNLLSSPENIIELFRNHAYLEALAMVVSWGTMWRRPASIYGRRLQQIQQTLQRCEASIVETQSVHDAWQMLTGLGPLGLGWSAVMASKTLHFLSRSLGFNQDPPVALDNAIIRERVWPAFITNIPVDQRPANWNNNEFEAYSRYMTAILTWANQRHWPTTAIEATLFHIYKV